MAGAGLRFAFVVFLFLNVSAFGAPAPPDTGGVHEEKLPAEGNPASKTSLDSATLVRSSESMKPPSGAASLDSSRELDHTGEKESKTAKNIDLPDTNSLVSNPDLKDSKESVNLQTKSKSADVPDSSPQKSDPEDIKNLPPATESSQPHTSVSDSSAHKPDLNEANQSGSLPGGSKGVQSVASVPDSTSLQSNPEEIKETKNLSPSTENDQSGATVLESSPQNPDHDKANQNKKLSEESKIVQSDVSLVDPSSRKSNHNEDKQSENVPEKSQTIQSDVSVADSPILKSGQNEASQNEKTPHSSAAGAESTPQKSDHNEDNQKDNGPAVAGNSLSDIPLPKDDDVDDDSLVDDEAFGGGKEGEETAETSQSDKEEAKNSPVGPSPKDGSENSHFFAYLVTTAIVVAALYIAYHNKRKIIAFALEGKKSKVIRRPKSSDYQRLDQKI